MSRQNGYGQVLRISGVDVYFHWSVLVIGGLILLGVVRKPAVTITALTSWLGVLLLHETGHMIAAQRKRCDVSCIEIGPLWGRTYFQEPWLRRDHAFIVWGGVLAQAAVAVPVILWISAFGYTRFESLNAAFALFGPFSLLIAIMNLIPIAPFDGALAWRLLPALFTRSRLRKVPTSGWRR